MQCSLQDAARFNLPLHTHPQRDEGMWCANTRQPAKWGAGGARLTKIGQPGWAPSGVCCAARASAAAQCASGTRAPQQGSRRPRCGSLPGQLPLIPYSPWYAHSCKFLLFSFFFYFLNFLHYPLLFTLKTFFFEGLFSCFFLISSFHFDFHFASHCLQCK